MSRALSAEFGDGSGIDLCGVRLYELFEEVNFEVIDPPFARLSDPTGPSLIIEPNGPQDIGEHDMVLVVSLEDFAPPNPPKINIQFKIEITGC